MNINVKNKANTVSHNKFKKKITNHYGRKEKADL